MATSGERILTAGGPGQVRRGRTARDLLLLSAAGRSRRRGTGAAGSSGRLVAAELAVRGLTLRLAGRRAGPIEELALTLAGDGASTEVRPVDLTDPASMASAIADVGVVV